jgi:ribA/ribD-fused uncharacterized protein
MNDSPIRSREQLVRAASSGQYFEFLFFWGHRPSTDGTITKSCLSQWFAAPFQTEGKLFPTSEHYMMAKKAELFGEPTLALQILEATAPGKAKALGRAVKHFDEQTWQAHRWGIVVEANKHKFSQHPRLQHYLLGTGSRVLVEASPVDTIWGIGLDARSPAAPNPSQWNGLNLLGFALMEVRAALSGNVTGSLPD